MKCIRCGNNFDESIVDVTNEDGFYEIACSEWCPPCNVFTMAVLFRESSAYRSDPKDLFDPMKGGIRAD